MRCHKTKTDGMNGKYSAGRQRGGETLNVD